MDGTKCILMALDIEPPGLNDRFPSRTDRVTRYSTYGNPISAEAVFRRQNMTSEDDPRTEGIKTLIMKRKELSKIFIFIV